MTKNNSKEVMSNLLPLYLKNKSLGKIQGKFQKGFNIKIEDKLIYISYVGSSLSAFGINIEKDKFFRILNSIEVNDNVRYKNGNIIIFSLKEIFYLNLEEIETVDLRIPKIKFSIKDIRNTCLYKILDSYKFEDYIGLNLEEVENKITLLENENKNNSFYNYEIINFFVGRGKGLTPSGDDILTGFTMGLMIFNDNGIFDKWIEDINLIVSDKKTTLVSVCYLKALTIGYISENFLNLINSIYETNDNKIFEILERVKSYGHTSGYDTLFGFYLSLKYLIKS